MPSPPAFETFAHDADIGVRGRGATLGEAFANAGRALTAVVTDPASVREVLSVEIACEASDPELLLFDWLNALVFEMATRRVLFARYEVKRGGRAAPRPRLRRAGGGGAAPAGGRGEGRDVDGNCAWRARAGRGSPSASWTSERRTTRGPLPPEAPLRARVGDRAAREDARARPPLRERAARARHGPQGLRAGHERGHPARHPHAPRWPCPTRTGATASRSGASPPSTPTRASSPRAASGFDISCGVRCLRTRLHPGRRRAEEEGPGRRALPGDPGRASGSRGPHPALGRRDGPHAARRRALGGREGLGRARRPRAHRGGRAR